MCGWMIKIILISLASLSPCCCCITAYTDIQLCRLVVPLTECSVQADIGWYCILYIIACQRWRNPCMCLRSQASPADFIKEVMGIWREKEMKGRGGCGWSGGADRVRQRESGGGRMWWCDGLSIESLHGVPPWSCAAKASGAPCQCVPICLFVFQELSL